MTTRRAILASALLAALALASGAQTFAATAHQHTPSSPTKLTLDHGKKWSTDEPLRKGMTEIGAALAAKKGGIHKGTLSSEDYKALGALIETRVATIVAECKLEPAADANLHLIVAELIAGAEAMQGKSTITPAAGALKTIGAVNQYGRYFNHPRWKPMD